MHKLKKKYLPGRIEIYNNSLFLANTNLSQIISKIDHVELFSYTKSLLELLSGLSGNSFTTLQNFLRSQVDVETFRGSTSVNLLSSTGQLLISLTELGFDLYSYPEVIFLLY